MTRFLAVLALAVALAGCVHAPAPIVPPPYTCTPTRCP